MEYYKKQFDEDKVREFLSTILASNVIKEAFLFFYGDDIKFHFLDEGNIKGKDKAQKFLKSYPKFIPLKYDDISSLK